MNIKNMLLGSILRGYASFLRGGTRVDPRRILFGSMPDYSDNSRALSDYLIENGYLEKYDIYWLVRDIEKVRRDNPDAKVTFISNKGWGLIRNLKVYLTAKWLFATHSNVGYANVPLREEQHYIRLWHGCSYKDKDKKDKMLTEQGKLQVAYEKALVAGPLFVKTKSYFWECPEEKILSIGYPRYDWLLKKTELAWQLYNALNNEGGKVVMWMPTYRVCQNVKYSDTNNISQFPLMANDSDWQKLDDYCVSKNVVVLVKLHPMQKSYDIKWNKFRNVKIISNEDFNRVGIQMYSFLAVTDGLISDYSSVAVDYMLVDKPIAFTLDDYELYKDGRGFVVPNPLDYMPGHHLYTVDDLLHYIDDISEGCDPYKGNREKIFGTLLTKSQHYCKDLVSILGL